MGQYYKCVNITTKEFIKPDGLKLMEHSYLYNRDVNYVLSLLRPSGPWHKSIIVWCGDYSEDNVVPILDGLSKDGWNHSIKRVNLYHCSELGYKELSVPEDYKRIDNDESGDKYLKSIAADIEAFPYLVNHTTKEYINLMTEITNEDAVHPLPLATASGNGLGGGDYSGEDDDRVGEWCGHCLSNEGHIFDLSEYEECVFGWKEQ